MEKTIVNEFVFNEMKYFTQLLDKEEKPTKEQKENILSQLNLTEKDYKFIYKKDSSGQWYKECYLGNEKINWSEIQSWMRGHVWEFEKDNRIFQ